MTSLVIDTNIDSDIDSESELVDPFDMSSNRIRCGPKSWKENQCDMGENSEVESILTSTRLEQLDVETQTDNNIETTQLPELQEAFGRFLDSPMNLAHKKYTIEIPMIGPGRPVRHYFDEERFEYELHFPVITNKKLARATGCNIVRCVAYTDENCFCGICNEGYCQEKAGSMWYDITDWKFAHLKCWKLLCENYYNYLREVQEHNTLINWLLFLTEEELID